MSVEEKPETAAQRLTDALIGRVTRYMTTYRLSQRQLAIHLGMSQAGLSLFLNQRRRPCNSIGFYERVCAVVGCTFGELVADVEANGRKAAAAAAAVAEPPREAPAAPLPTPPPTPPPNHMLDAKLAAIDQRAMAARYHATQTSMNFGIVQARNQRLLVRLQQRQLRQLDHV